MDYQIHKAALYTMATCHSLRVVDGELVGDPLDVKMFQFTDWSFEENGRKPSIPELDGLENGPYSVAMPQDGQEYDIDETATAKPVSTSEHTVGFDINHCVEYADQTLYIEVLRICVSTAPSKRGSKANRGYQRKHICQRCARVHEGDLQCGKLYVSKR